MATQLTKPFINTVNAFDATIQNAIPFSILGGAVITSYTYTIFDVNNTSVYSNTIAVTNDNESVDIRTFNMPIAANTLTNNSLYKIQVTTSNPTLAPEITALTSNSANFKCYKTPTFEIQYSTTTPAQYIKLANGTTIESDVINAQLVFQTNDINSTALLDNAVITMYGINAEQGTSTLVFQGVPLYNAPLQETLTGLIPITQPNYPYDTYSITVSGITTDGFAFNGIDVSATSTPQIETSLTGIICNYNIVTNSPNITVTNLCSQGLIEIQSNFSDYLGISNPSPPTYIDNHKVDLTDSGAWVRWQYYFTATQPYTLRIWGYEFTSGSTVVQLLTGTINQVVQVNYYNINNEAYVTLFAYVQAADGTQLSPYYIESERIDSSAITASTQLFIGVQQDSNLYEITLVNMG